MRHSSIAKAWLEMLLIGPRLSWRVVEMAIASARVVRHRRRLVTRGPKTRRERREYRRMIQEKFHGGGEATNAYFKALSESGIPLAKITSSAVAKTFSAWLTLFNSHSLLSIISAYAQFIRAAGWLAIVVPGKIIIFLATVFLRSTEPLAERVSANAKRLSAAHKKN